MSAPRTTEDEITADEALHGGNDNPIDPVVVALWAAVAFCVAAAWVIGALGFIGAQPDTNPTRPDTAVTTSTTP